MPLFQWFICINCYSFLYHMSFFSMIFFYGFLYNTSLFQWIFVSFLYHMSLFQWFMAWPFDSLYECDLNESEFLFFLYNLAIMKFLPLVLSKKICQKILLPYLARMYYLFHIWPDCFFLNFCIHCWCLTCW